MSWLIWVFAKQEVVPAVDRGGAAGGAPQFLRQKGEPGVFLLSDILDLSSSHSEGMIEAIEEREDEGAGGVSLSDRAWSALLGVRRRDHEMTFYVHWASSAHRDPLAEREHHAMTVDSPHQVRTGVLLTPREQK